jgi:hypothetical protein
MKDARHGLTPEQAVELADRGVTRLPAAVPARDIGVLLDVLWARLQARCGAVRDRPATWTTHRPGQLTSRADELAAMASPPVRAALDALLGVGGWKAPPRWSLPLVTFPGFDRDWDVPHRNWHLDLAVSAEPPRLARIFVLLDRAEPGGGGTGYVAGSHRVLRQLARKAGRPLSSGEARKRLVAREPWFAALETRRAGEDRIARFMAEDGMADGVPVRVCEMTGDAGDMFIMDPHVLHAMTPNVRETPRMMLTEWVYGR